MNATQLSASAPSPSRPTWTVEEYREQTNLLLLPQHHAQLLDSGISLEVAASRGYWSATRKRELEDLGFRGRQLAVIREVSRSEKPAAALVVPIWWTDPEEPVLHQVRPDDPRRSDDGKPVKYETPARAGVKLDINPIMRDQLGDPSVPLLITEGVKKVDAATGADLVCVGLMGVSAWRGRNNRGGLTTLSQWNDVALKGRQIYLVFDSDVMTKAPVHRELLKLRSWLEDKGADVYVVYLPAGELGRKVGLDDFLTSGHDRDDLLSLATKEMRRPHQTERDAAEWFLGDYIIQSDGIHQVISSDMILVTKQLTNFIAHIREKVFLDADEDNTAPNLEAIQYRLVLVRDKHRREHEVSAARFETMRWLAEVRDLDLWIAAGSSVRDHVRSAIELFSVEIARKKEKEHDLIPRRTVYTHTGWRRVDGKQVYLHAGGAIGESGPVEGIEVRLEPPLAPFALPNPTPAEVVKAVRASLSLLDLGPDRLMVPELGAAYRAVLGPADFGVHVHGASGRFKSAVLAVIQSHFGGPFDLHLLPLGWTSTGNALEGLLFLAAHMAVVVDDFLPSGLSARQQQDQLAAAARVFRAQGNQRGRTRMRADTTIRPDRWPRGIVLSTGEELPRGLSQLARVWTLEQGADDVSKERLTAAQENADRLPAAMAGYVRWLAPQMDGMAEWLRAGQRRLRPVYEAPHRRTADIASNLELGWDRFTAFAVAIGAISEDERTELLDRVRKALLDGIDEQAGNQAQADPVERFLSGLRAALMAGECHVSAPGGRQPKDPSSWGWRLRESHDIDIWEPRGLRVGWLSDDLIWLLPEPAYNAAAAQYPDGLGIGQIALRSRLRDRDLLACPGEGRHITVRTPRTIDPHRPRVLVLPENFDSLPKSGTSGTSGTNEDARQDSNSESGPTGPTGDPTGGLTLRCVSGTKDDGDVGPGPIRKLALIGLGPTGPTGPTPQEREGFFGSDDEEPGREVFDL